MKIGIQLKHSECRGTNCKPPTSTFTKIWFYCRPKSSSTIYPGDRDVEL